MSDGIFGLDIGSSTLKLVLLSKHHETCRLQSCAMETNPIGSAIPNTSEERVRVAASIQSLFRSSGVVNRKGQKVRISIPESLAYTKVIQTPLLTDTELATAIRWEAEQHIPVPLSDVYLDYAVLFRPERGTEETMDILLVAAKRRVVNSFVDLSEAAGFELVAIDTSLLSASRALVVHGDPPTLLIHTGATSTDFAISVKGKMLMNHSISTAGHAMTHALEFALSLSTAQAEQYKRTYGLKPDLLEGKVRSVLLGLFRTISDEAKNLTMLFEKDHKGVKIQRVVLSGGTALLPDMPKEIANSLGVSEVIVGDPFAGIAIPEKKVIPSDYAAYAVAVGLAKREDS